MSNAPQTFIDRCLEGAALSSDIDDFVDEWHDGDSELDLHDFLGMSFEEYSLWTEKPRSLKQILYARRVGLPIRQATQILSSTSIAARRPEEEGADELLDWLKRTNRLPQ